MALVLESESATGVVTCVQEGISSAVHEQGAQLDEQAANHVARFS